MLTRLIAGYAHLIAAAGFSASPDSLDTTPRPSAPVLRYTFTNSSTEGRNKREEVNLAGTAFVRGDDVRIEIKAGGSEFLVGPGAYLLANGQAGTLTAVDVDRRRYFQLPTSMLQLGLAGMTGAAQSLVKLEVSGLETRGEKIGAGPSIAGYPTTIYRVSQRYALRTTAMGIAVAENCTSEIDFHVAAALLKELDNPFMRIRIEAAEMIPGGTTGLGEVVRQVVAEQEKWFVGTPVKTVTRTRSVDEQGKETVSTATNEITSVTRVDVSPAMFVVPDGYTRVENPLSTLAAEKIGNASNVPGAKLATEVGDAAKNGAKQGLTDEVRQGAREAVAKKVRGLFRKP